MLIALPFVFVFSIQEFKGGEHAAGVICHMSVQHLSLSGNTRDIQLFAVWHGFSWSEATMLMKGDVK